MKNQINIIISGYGVFGSQFLEWLKINGRNICVLCIIEPNRHKRDLIKKLGYAAYENIYDIPTNMINETRTIVDCSPRGVGLQNKKDYLELNLPAIFQNGEEDQNIGSLYYPGLVDWAKPPRYLKIPLCSGIAAIKIAKCINKLTKVNYITGYHGKVTNTARMLTMDYLDSNIQIGKLLGIESRMNVIYARGEPHNGIFAYHGNLDLELDQNINLNEAVKALSDKKELLKMEDQEIDNFSYQKTDMTVVIKESIHIRNKVLRLSTMSFTPDVNFPINLSAIMYLSKSEI